MTERTVSQEDAEARVLRAFGSTRSMLVTAEALAASGLSRWPPNLEAFERAVDNLAAIGLVQKRLARVGDWIVPVIILKRLEAA